MALNIGIIGLGTVGGGTYELLNKRKDEIAGRVGCEVKIKKACDLNTDLKKQLDIPDDVFTSDYREIIDDEEISLVVVLTGNSEFAFKVIEESFNKSKHVVTANKALVAARWKELFALARKNGSLLYFEASVGSGIPVIQGINEGLAANDIDEIVGILNGTTNYVLTKMTKECSPFEKALESAVEEGFAEPDSTADIKGHDAAHKICVLANVVNRIPVDFEDIYCEGIDNIELTDIKYAGEMFGFTVKLISVMKKHGNEIEMRVHPAFLPEDHMLKSVNYENSGILVHGDAVDKVMFYGKGAGRYAAASAVVSDVIYLAQKINYGIAGKIPYIHTSAEGKTSVIKMEDLDFQYYVRFTTVDQPSVLATISGILGKNDVSIASCFQKGVAAQEDVHIIVISHKAKEGNLKKALEEIDALNITKKKTVFIRIESEKETF
jgi:homoserine dehydrogenase